MYRKNLTLSAICLGVLAGLALSGAHAVAASPKAAPTAAKTPTAADTKAATPGDPKAFMAGVYKKLNAVATQSAKRADLHTRIGAEMAQFMDYEEMGRRALGKKTWGTLSEEKRAQFTKLLTAMVQNTYVRRFKPGTAVTITYAPKVRMKKDGRAQVRTTIRVKRTSAAVNYSMIPRAGLWKVYDIIVDDVSQLGTYKRSFRKILKREGWDGLIARMTKSARS